MDGFEEDRRVLLRLDVNEGAKEVVYFSTLNNVVGH